jgi:hypothetical protein
VQPSPELVRRLHAEEIERARAMTPADRLLEGPRLFDRACRIMADGIRHRYPGAGAEEVARRLRAQLDLIERLESRE